MNSEEKTDLPVIGKPFRKLFCYGMNGRDKVFYMADITKNTDRTKGISFEEIKHYGAN